VRRLLWRTTPRTVLLVQLPIPPLGPTPIRGNVPLAAAYLKLFAERSGLGHSYAIGFLYFLAPVLALFTIFLPKGALQQGGLSLAVYLILVNLPYGIVTALVARAIIGKKP
jgi:hypothetical protein